jgi:hypothetical protein
MLSMKSRVAVGAVAAMVTAAAIHAAPRMTGAKTAGGPAAPAAYAIAPKPPTGAVILFNGKDLRNWQQRDGKPAAWAIKDGAMTAAASDLMTNRKFADAFIHVEFREPKEPAPERGNSGVYIQGRYEIQVIDSYGTKIPGKGDCGAIYDQYAPLVNATKPPMEWQSFDVIFRAARVDESGKVTERARMTVLLNGVVIQNNVEALGPTGSALDDRVGEPGPLLLQYHGSAVEYRNVWAVELPLAGSDTYRGR